MTPLPPLALRGDVRASVERAIVGLTRNKVITPNFGVLQSGAFYAMIHSTLRKVTPSCGSDTGIVGFFLTTGSFCKPQTIRGYHKAEGTWKSEKSLFVLPGMDGNRKARKRYRLPNQTSTSEVLNG